MFLPSSSDSQMRSCCSFFHEVPTSELRSFFMNIVSNVGTSLISRILLTGNKHERPKQCPKIRLEKNMKEEMRALSPAGSFFSQRVTRLFKLLVYPSVSVSVRRSADPSIHHKC